MKNDIKRVLSFIGVLGVGLLWLSCLPEDAAFQYDSFTSFSQFKTFQLKRLNQISDSGNKLPIDIDGIIDEAALKIDLSVPTGTNVSSLKSVFTIEGFYVSIANAVQESGKTANDFTKTLIYSIYAEDSSISNYNVAVTFFTPSETAPEAFNLAISGETKVFANLVGSYNYADVNFDAEDTTGSGSSFRWLRSDTVDGTYTAIAVSKNYSATADDLDKYLKFEVTPKALTGTTDGVAMLSAAFGPIGVGNALPQVVISEIGVDMGGAPTYSACDFIELYNPTSGTVDISGASVQRVSDSNFTSGSIDLYVLTGTIKPYGFFLIGDSGCTTYGVTLDLTDANMVVNADDVVLLVQQETKLTACTNSAILDKVGMGANTCPETATITNPGSNKSVERKALSTDTATTLASGTSQLLGNAYDTNNNSTDFVVQTTMNPQNTSSTSEGGPDTTAPTVVSSIPASGATAISTASTIQVTFSEAMDVSTLTTTTSTSCSGSFLVSTSSSFAAASCVAMNSTTPVAGNGDKTFIITPAANLAVTSQYFVKVSSSVKDKALNSLAADYSFNFTTGVASVALVINEVAVNNNAGTGEDFIELRVTAGGLMNGYKLYEYGSGTPTLLYTFDSAFSPATNDLIVLHLDRLQQAGFINEDLGGNSKTSSPAGAPGTQPNAVDTAWDVYETVTVSDTGLTSTDNCIYITDASDVVLDAVCLSNKDGTASTPMMGVYGDFYDDHAPQNADTVVIKEDMWPFTALPVDGSNDQAIQDMCVTVASGSGNSSQRTAAGTDTNAASDFINATQTMGTANTVTPDTTPPTVASKVPTSAATGIALSTTIQVTFSEAMTTATLTTTTSTTCTGSFQVSTTAGFTAGTCIAMNSATPVATNSDMTFTITPTANLAVSTLYYVKVTTAVTDAATSPNAMASNHTYSFTTGAAPASLVINEAAFNNTGTQGEDFIELRITTAGSMNGYKLYEYSSASGTLLYTFDSTFSPALGDLIVFHHDSANQAGFINEDLGGNSKTSNGTQTPGTQPNGNDNAWDVYGADTGLTRTDNCIYVTDASGVVLDALCISNQDGTATTTMMGVYSDFYDDHAPQNADTGKIKEDMWPFTASPVDGSNDAAIQGMCTLFGTGVAGGNSLQRNSSGTDTNAASDFTVAAQTMGTANP